MGLATKTGCRTEKAGWGAAGRALGGALGLLVSLGAPEARAQGPPPSVNQDELDFQARTSLAIGSGARAFGMGGAFLARADDATAASWNPAGLSYLRRPEFSIVGSWSSLDSQVLGTAGPNPPSTLQDDSSRGTTPDFASVTYPFEIRSFSAAAQLSFQRVFPFEGKRTILRDPNKLVLSSQGGFDTLAFGTGVQLTRRLRVGATVNRWFDGFRQTRRRVEGRPSIQTLDFQLSGWNANLGVIWSPIGDLNLALAGRTPFTGRVTLDRTRIDLPDQPRITTNGFSSDGIRLDFPGAFGAGASWRPRSTLTISADYTRTFWSSARIHNFFTLPVTGPPLPPDDLFVSLPYPGLESRQTDTEQFRLGVERVLLGRRLKVPLRFGLFTDRQYFRAADGKVPRFYGFTVGAGLLVGPLLFDVAYVYEDGGYSGGSASRTDVKIQRVYASLIYRHQGQP